MKRWIIISLFCLLLFVGCATNTSTNTTTTLVRVVNPSYQGAEYNSMLVFAPYDDLILKKLVESLFRSAIVDRDTKVLRGIDVFPPLKEYTESEVRDSLESLGIQVVLVIGQTDFWNTFHTTQGRTETEFKNNKATTRYFSGITLSQSNVKLDIRLLDYGKSDVSETIWRSSLQTSGDFSASGSTVVWDAAQEVAKQLTADGILNEPISVHTRASLMATIMLKGGSRQLVNLGLLSCNDFEQSSVYAKHGLYGIKAEQSIWHPCGLYASPVSPYSACNPEAKYPPIIVNGFGDKLGVLTVNQEIVNEYETRRLRKWLLKEICGQCEDDSTQTVLTE